MIPPLRLESAEHLCHGTAGAVITGSLFSVLVQEVCLRNIPHEEVELACGLIYLDIQNVQGWWRIRPRCHLSIVELLIECIVYSEIAKSTRWIVELQEDLCGKRRA
jgi:hypothetical protein